MNILGIYTHLIIALLSGLAMGATTAPLNLWPLAWVALAPLWCLTIAPRFQNLSLRALTLSGFLWGMGFYGLSLAWITGIHPMTWMGVPWLASLAIAGACWLTITLWGAVLVVVWILGVTLIARQKLIPPPLRVLAGVALWSGLETLWSLGPLWWPGLGFTQSPFNLAILHLGQLSGPVTVSAIVVAINGLIAEAWVITQTRSPANRSQAPQFWQNPYGFAALGLLVSLHGLGFWLYQLPLEQPTESALRVGIIQGNVPNTIKLYPEGWRRAIAGYTTGYRALAAQQVDAVLTPETALPYFWQDWGTTNQGTAPPFYAAIRDEKVPAWVGAFGDRQGHMTNSLFMVSSSGQILSQYDKVKLVPLGEYIPFASLLSQFINRLSPLEATMVAGQPEQVFTTPFGPAIVGICYESAFADHFRRQAAQGGLFILSPSNDAHYSASMPAQHHAQDIMRAIETDRWAVRATNTGYSAIVDPHGNTHWLSQLNTYEIHAGTIYRRNSQTLYVRWGNWLTPLLLGLTLVLLGLRLLPRQFSRTFRR